MRFRTRAIHAGQGPDPAHGAVMTPVYQTSTFAFAQPDVAPQFDYTRSGNPTRHALEQCLASLEGGERAFAFASGMAAIAAELELVGPGEHVLASDEVYGGTYRLLHRVCAPRGIEVSHADFADLDATRAAIRPNTRMLWTESPTNPLMKIVDLAALAEMARSAGALSACDNTFLSPYFQNPLALGMDIVVHSTTKYINGHSDVLGGAVIVKDTALAERIYFLQNAIGAVQAPWDCFLILRGVKTLALRMEAHNTNALALAEFLEAHPKTERVLHPGLESHPQYALNQRQARGAGGTFSFFVRGGEAETFRFLKQLTLFPQAVSLGGVESLIEHPWSMTHISVPEPERRKMGIAPNLVRVSVGLEDVQDLIEDMEKALGKI